MNVAVSETADIDTAEIVPSMELLDANAALGDAARLDAIYNEQGYLLLRQVLDPASARTALQSMMAVMARHRVVAPDAEEPIWTGVSGPGGLEESSEFAGICKNLIEDPANLKFFELLLGEGPASVPIVQYRSYAPHTPLGRVHQDGFYSPGIHGFRPVWIPLMTIDPDVGGLMLVPGHDKHGLIHNLAKPPSFPIPSGLIPADGWATTTFHAGDVLIIHPHMPHVGGYNRSNRVRFSIDTRIQSAAHPCVLLGNIVATTPAALTIRTADGDRTLAVDEETYIRTSKATGTRIPLDHFQSEAPVGLRVVAAVDGERATMIRRAAEG